MNELRSGLHREKMHTFDKKRQRYRDRQSDKERKTKIQRQKEVKTYSPKTCKQPRPIPLQPPVITATLPLKFAVEHAIVLIVRTTITLIPIYQAV